MKGNTKNKQNKKRQETKRKMLIITLCIFMVAVMFLPYLAVLFS